MSSSYDPNRQVQQQQSQQNPQDPRYAPPPAPAPYTPPPAPPAQDRDKESYFPERGKYTSRKAGVFFITLVIFVAGVVLTASFFLSLVTLVYIPGLSWVVFYMWPVQLQVLAWALMIMIGALDLALWAWLWAKIFNALYKGIVGSKFRG